MERDFEQEFKELKLNEIPDLWNRIEAGLSEKKVTVSVPDRRTISEKEYAPKKSAEKSAKRLPWKKWGTLAAACLCIAIIYPMISLILRNMESKSNSYSGSTAEKIDIEEDGASTAKEQENAGMPDSMQAAENADTSIQTDLTADDSASSMAGADMPADHGTADMPETETAADSDISDSAKDEMETEAGPADMSEEKESMVGQVLEDGQILESVIVQITEAYIFEEECIYQAVVLQPDENMILQNEMQIDIICNADTEYNFLRGPREKKVLKNGEKYEISLRYERDGEEEKFIVIAASIGK